MIKLKYVFTSALLVAAASASQAVSRKQMRSQLDKDAPCIHHTGQGFHLPDIHLFAIIN